MTPTELRTERNARLALTDYYMLVDVYGTLADAYQALIREYRQSLRDLPSTYDGTGVPAWPHPPTLSIG